MVTAQVGCTTAFKGKLFSPENHVYALGERPLMKLFNQVAMAVKASSSVQFVNGSLTRVVKTINAKWTESTATGVSVVAT